MIGSAFTTLLVCVCKMVSLSVIWCIKRTTGMVFIIVFAGGQQHQLHSARLEYLDPMEEVS